MTGIRELFAELSQPDEFTQQRQMELFQWAEIMRWGGHGYVAYVKFKCRCDVCRKANRDYMRGYHARKTGKTTTRAYRCGNCGENGHSAPTCEQMQRAA